MRETLNRHRGLTSGIALSAVLAAVGFALYDRFGAGRPGPSPTNQAYYTDDDGQTLFADKMDKVCPFDHNGKPAYRAYVFTCDNGKTRFVSRLERYSAEAIKKIDAARAKNGQLPAFFFLDVADQMEAKRPGDPDTGWVRASAGEAFNKVMEVRCPNAARKPEIVLP